MSRPKKYGLLEGSHTDQLIVSDVEAHIGDVAAKVYGPRLMLRKGTRGSPADGVGVTNYPTAYVSSIYGGANEIQRNIIATRGLGLPR